MVPRHPRLVVATAWTLGVAGAALVALTLGVAGRIGEADAPHLISTELRLAQLVLDGEPVRALTSWWALLAPHPPLGAVPGWVVLVLTGGDPRAVWLTVGVALVAAFDAYVRLARRFTDGPVAAVGAFAFLLGSPMLWSGAEQYSRDLFVGVAALQAISWAVAPGGLAVRRNAIGFGVAMGMAFGTKYTGPLFLVGGAVILGATMLARRDRAEWRGLARAVGAFAVVAGLWYATHLGSVRAYFSVSNDVAALAGQSGSITDTTAAGVHPYYWVTLWQALSGPGVLLLLLGALIGCIRARDRLPTAVVVAAAVGGVLVLSRLALQVDRYALPALLLACALVLPLARHPAGLLLVLGVAAPRVWASADRFRPGRAGHRQDYAHPVSGLQSAHYPIAREFWFPSPFDPSAWALEPGAHALKAAQGDRGTVGLLVPGDPNWPGFGHLSIAAAAVDGHWDWATVNLRRVGDNAPPVFVGPLFDEHWPPSAFSVLVAFEGPGVDGAVGRWLSEHPGRELSRTHSAKGVDLVVYRLAD